MAKKSKSSRAAAGSKSAKKTVQPLVIPAKALTSGSRFFVRPVAEIPKVEEEISPPPDEQLEQPLTDQNQVAARLCLDARDVEGNGLQVWGDYFEDRRVIRIEGTFPGWRLIRSISADQAAEMVENVCIFLEASGDLMPKMKNGG